jgi:hypothetical protein
MREEFVQSVLANISTSTQLVRWRGGGDAAWALIARTQLLKKNVVDTYVAVFAAALAVVDARACVDDDDDDDDDDDHHDDDGVRKKPTTKAQDKELAKLKRFATVCFERTFGVTDKEGGDADNNAE